jgi:hypothetical protein
MMTRTTAMMTTWWTRRHGQRQERGRAEQKDSRGVVPESDGDIAMPAAPPEGPVLDVDGDVSMTDALPPQQQQPSARPVRRPLSPRLAPVSPG